MGDMSAISEAPVLVQVAQKLRKTLSCDDVETADFVELCYALISVFDNLGTVFCFAKKEFAVKNHSLREVSGEFRTLKELVNHDKKVTPLLRPKKNSCARNLHRLSSALTFIMTLMTELTGSMSMSLREAAHTAYQVALAPIHTAIVRSVVIAGLLALPARESFLESLHETETSARERTDSMRPLVEELVNYIESLYDAPMPVSNTWFIST